jgi:hypothetical protein
VNGLADVHCVSAHLDGLSDFTDHVAAQDRVKTIAGMALIAEQGELYYNLHTKGQTFFGDIRGQLTPVR